MRLTSFFAATLGLMGAAVGTLAQVDDTPTLNVVTTFPNNDFNVVRNGESNRVVFGITNPPGTERILSLESITGAYLNPNKQDGQRGRVLRNMTTLQLKSPKPIKSIGRNGKALHQIFDFYSEFKPQPLDVEFSLGVRDGQTSRLYRLPVYSGQVQVVEPPKNWFDPQVYVPLLLAFPIPVTVPCVPVSPACLPACLPVSLPPLCSGVTDAEFLFC